MPQRANVTSFEAIKTFRSNLIGYMTKARPALEEVSSEVTRTRLWLQGDRRSYWEGEARRRSLVWDPQVKKGLELVPKSELLLKNPQQFIAERVAQAQTRPATTAGNPQ